MRRLAYILLLVLTACSMAVPDDADPQVVLSFQPVVSPMTKAVDMTGLTVGVSGWTMKHGLGWIYGSETEEFLTCSRVVPGPEEKWYLEDMKLWPSSRERLTVIGYAPYEQAQGCDEIYGVRFDDVNVLETQPLLYYTEPQADLVKTVSGGMVSLPLQHALCHMEFKVRSRVAPEEQVSVKRITLDSACYTGDFRSLPQPKWTASGLVRDVEFSVQQPRLMIPQQLSSSVTVEFDYTNAAGLAIPLVLKTAVMEKKLYPGQHYTFVLSVGVDDVKFLSEIL